MAPRRDASLGQLRRLVASFAAPRSPTEERAVRRLAGALGPAAAPSCLRELASTDADHRQWATALLREIARVHRDRVLRGVRALLADEVAATVSDDAKLDALGLLAELGETSAPTHFADPAAIQRRSALHLAEHLVGAPSEIASTADMVLKQLAPDDLIDLVESLSEIAPEGAARLVDELTVRLDVDAAMRSDLRRIAAPLPRPATVAVSSVTGRPSLLAMLRDARGRTVVAICRRCSGERRWRALSVLIDERGGLTDAVYDDECPPQRLAARVVGPLLDDGYREVDATFAAVRRAVGDAARRAAQAGALAPGYYLGRDLLALGDIHIAERALPDEHATLLGRAVDLLAIGEAARARPLLERCVATCADDAEAASSLGLCLLALGELTGAQAWLDRAASLEPAWPLHHWNAAAAAHRAGRLGACYLALRAFLEIDAAATPLARGDGHGHRLDVARRFIADYERVCRLDGEDPAARATAERRRPLRAKRRAAPLADAPT